MKKWTIDDSRELYNINGWGTSYFGVNDKGDMYVTPCKDNVQIDLRDVMDELIDRFGDVPPEAENLLWIALLRGLAARLGIELVFLRMGKLLMRFSPYTKVDGQKLIDSLNRMKDTRLSLRQTRSETLLALNQTGEPEGLMESAVDELENLLDEMKRR